REFVLDEGLDLASPIHQETLEGRELFWVGGEALVACLDSAGAIGPAFAKRLAERQPVRVVIRDALYPDSASKINVEQVFKLWSPATELRCL
ncbi:MAG: site-specific DNA-methyltransferase, partial [Giesbergeria sp.]